MREPPSTKGWRSTSRKVSFRTMAKECELVLVTVTLYLTLSYNNPSETDGLAGIRAKKSNNNMIKNKQTKKKKKKRKKEKI